MDWWRAYHGIPYDSKLAVVARRCGVKRAEVLAVWVACLDFASQHEDRGSVQGIDPEEVAVSLDLETETVECVLAGFRQRDMLSVTPCDATCDAACDGHRERITAWERRQVRRERDDDSTERTRRYRQKLKPKELPVETPVKRHVTPCDAPEQNRTEQIRTENKPLCSADAEPGLFPLDEKRAVLQMKPTYGKAWFDSEHDAWYAGYWNHTGKAKSRAAYEKRIRRLVGQRKTYEDAASFLREEAAAYRQRFELKESWSWRVRLHPSTWLNGELWTDEDEPEAMSATERAMANL